MALVCVFMLFDELVWCAFGRERIEIDKHTLKWDMRSPLFRKGGVFPHDEIDRLQLIPLPIPISGGQFRRFGRRIMFKWLGSTNKFLGMDVRYIGGGLTKYQSETVYQIIKREYPHLC